MWHLQSPKPKYIAQLVLSQVFKAAYMHTVNVRLYVTWGHELKSWDPVERDSTRDFGDRGSKISRFTNLQFSSSKNRYLVISTTEVSMLYLEFGSIIVPLWKVAIEKGPTDLKGTNYVFILLAL